MDGIAVWMAGGALIVASAALGLSVWTAARMRRPASPTPEAPPEEAPDPAAALTDAALVWQQLAIDFETLQGDARHSVIGEAVKTAVADWLTQLQEFCVRSRSEADQAYQLIARDIRNQVPPQLPDLDRYNKETRSPVAVIADQIAHLRQVMRGHEPLRGHAFRVTLHRGQVLAHYLAKRKKLAELKLRRQGRAAA